MVKKIVLAALIKRGHLLIAATFLVLGAAGLAAFRPVPDSLPWEYALPYETLFKACLVLGGAALLLQFTESD